MGNKRTQATVQGQGRFGSHSERGNRRPVGQSIRCSPHDDLHLEATDGRWCIRYLIKADAPENRPMPKSSNCIARSVNSRWKTIFKHASSATENERA